MRHKRDVRARMHNDHMMTLTSLPTDIVQTVVKINKAIALNLLFTKHVIISSQSLNLKEYSVILTTPFL